MTTVEQRTYARKLECELDGLYFARYFFKYRTGSKMIIAPHHRVISETLQRVINGEITRLIINVPPGYTKTELATINFIAHGLAVNNRARFMHLSYSHNLALLNSSTSRAIIKSSSYQAMWPMTLRDDTDSKAMWWTEHGGGVYASSSGGQVTGFRAGHMEPGWQGCFPAGTLVETEHGPRSIDDIVSTHADIRVWSCDIATGRIELQPVIGWWENPPNEIVEVGLSDGTIFHCTPDHRIYTIRGYVRADSLSSSDLLPTCAPHAFKLGIGDAEGFSNNVPRSGSVKKNIISELAEPLSASVVLSCGQIGSDGGPCFPQLNLSNDANNNPISIRKGSGRGVASEDCTNLIAGQLGSGSALKNGKGSMTLGIRHVLGLCTPRKIAKSVIRWATVKVSAFVFRLLGSVKCLKNQLVNVLSLDLALPRKAHPEIAFPVDLLLEHNTGECIPLPLGRNNQSTQAADSTKSADFIKSIVSGGRRPLFVRHIGHVENTYCLSVRCNSNFILSSGGVLVHNCLIIDDPVKPDDAYSETVRNGVNNSFNETIKSRLAIETTPIIVIMQRIHYQDLSGYLLRGGSGEKWHHLNLPVIINNSVPYPEENTHGIPIEHGLPDGWLWPYKHSEINRVSLESHRRTFEAQYMQAPRRFNAEGALWTEQMIADAHSMVIPFEKSRTVIAIDPQATNSDTSDETGIVAASAYGGGKERMYSLDGDYSGKFSPNGWATAAIDAYKTHEADAIVIETNQGGDMAEETLRNAGFNGRIIRVHASKGKFARAEPISALYSQGKVSHLGNLYQVENQFLEYVPATAKKSPDRLDAAVWGLTELSQSSTGLNMNPSIVKSPMRQQVRRRGING